MAATITGGSITVNATFAADYFKRLDDRMADLTPVMNSIGVDLETRISNRFETRKAPGGSAWAPWAESTKASYPANAHNRLLDRYGAMLRSLSSRATKTSITVGFGQHYLAYHEHGTKHMPRRGVLFDNPEAGTLGRDDQESILHIVSLYLDS